MKLSEVIEKLTQRPEKVFESFDGLGKKYMLSVEEGYFFLNTFASTGELIEDKFSGRKFSGNIGVDSNWKEVEQPVTWQEAINAWAKGSTIRLVMPQLEQIWNPENIVQLNRSKMRDGKWFIKGDQS